MQPQTKAKATATTHDNWNKLRNRPLAFTGLAYVFKVFATKVKPTRLFNYEILIL